MLRSWLKFLLNIVLATIARIQLSAGSEPRLIILTYHRVLPVDDTQRLEEQPGMIISPENFEKHLIWAKKNKAELTHLDDWLERRRCGKPLPKLSIAFTFDDGWRDNFLYAYPLLTKHQVPATIFLVTGVLGEHRPFWPEQVIRLLTTHQLELNHESTSWLKEFLEENRLNDGALSLLKADQVVNRLKSLDDATILSRLQSIYNAFPDLTPPEDGPFILTREDIQTMAASGTVRFGAHSRNHFRLNRINNQKLLEKEIAGCQGDLDKAGIPATQIFCYPNGDITNSGEALVKEHFNAACTTKTGINTPNTGDHELKRFNLHDGNSANTNRLLATIGRAAT